MIRKLQSGEYRPVLAQKESQDPQAPDPELIWPGHDAISNGKVGFAPVNFRFARDPGRDPRFTGILSLWQRQVARIFLRPPEAEISALLLFMLKEMGGLTLMLGLCVLAVMAPAGATRLYILNQKQAHVLITPKRQFSCRQRLAAQLNYAIAPRFWHRASRGN